MKKTEGEQEKQVNGMETSIAVILTKVNYIEGEIKNLVTKDQFDPVQKIAYGLASTILTAVLIAIIYMVVKK